MHANASFDYAVLRVVPRVEREEFINAGVILFCLERRFLGCRIALDEIRLRSVWRAVDVDLVRKHLHAVQMICEGDPAGGPIAKLPQRERFHWLTAPRSTILQTSPVRTGICVREHEGCTDLDRRLQEIAERML